ncbi:adhesion G-protein coupled receptor G2-like [Protopterus annectens]|uniref:adhesion G-protein coupled receptor G2-like n=1 Tax=Protopterus annectens TaxID=7888 RepID=UPI001CFB7D8A|nr:adhesion G-protein coupled receptor G2-like [Protopterus annectens]
MFLDTVQHFRKWRSSGCRTLASGHDKVTCECHFDYFSAFLIYWNSFQAAADLEDTAVPTSVTFISLTGTIISGVFIAIVIVMHTSHRKDKTDHSIVIHNQLFCALFLLDVSFLLNEWLTTFRNDILCKTAALTTHYAILCCLSWMLMEAIHLYLVNGKVFSNYIRHYILRLCMISWGVPLIVVIIIASLDKYGTFPNIFQDKKRTSFICWIKDPVVHYVTVFGYFGVIFIFNVIILVAVSKNIIQMKRHQIHDRQTASRNACAVLSLICLVGLTWGVLFFFFGTVHVAVHYIFSILNALQGFFIFVWYCSTKKSVLKSWISRSRQKINRNENVIPDAT